MELERNNDSNEPKTKAFYQDTWSELMDELERNNPVVYESIIGGRQFREKMHEMSVWLKETLRAVKVNPKKQRFRSELKNAQSQFYMADFGAEGLSSPLDPRVKLYGVDADACTIFRSAIQPILFQLKTRQFSDNVAARETQPLPELENRGIIYKNGDDLRQDQLVLMLFKLMDILLKEVNLDFKFTSYKCIAVTKEVGFMEFVPNSETIQQVQFDSNYNLHAYLTGITDDEQQKKEIFTNYLLSCAGYGVATYLLAIGDRHLENLMLIRNGKMFHLDFGYILGKNPPKKGVLVPPIRINKPMVLGLGGVNSAGYREFVSKTIDAFLYLRNYRNLIMNLMTLMVDSSIENLPKAEADKLLSQMNERFLPHLSNEQARK